jgi:hypothetical protein
MNSQPETTNSQDRLDPSDRSDTNSQNGQQAAKSHPFVHWRKKAGYLSDYGSECESVHILLGRFLADHNSPDPLIDKSLLADNPQFDWGNGAPLEKVIDSQEAFEYLMTNPQLFRNAIAIIEPWEHVGYNPLGEHVRASINVAYLGQKIADCDSILFPVWASGLFDLDRLIPVINSGVAIVVEGGDPSLRDPDSFAGSNCSHQEMVKLTEKIILSRTPTSSPAIFICLGHQLSAQAHISLIRQAVDAVLNLDTLVNDSGGKILRHLKKVCQKIQAVGNSLSIQKKDGRVIANSWADPEFAVGKNELQEVGDRAILAYECPDYETSEIPEEVIMAHEVTADEYEGVIDTSLEYEPGLNISMFHTDEVNEEAILFANWAYRLIHDALIHSRHLIANSSLSWLIKLPYAIEILCSTADDGEVITECSATCINYKDFETKQIRRSFTCQFHPELLSDLRVVGDRQPPSYEELKKDDGARLFARLLYTGMQE